MLASRAPAPQLLNRGEDDRRAGSAGRAVKPATAHGGAHAVHDARGTAHLRRAPTLEPDLDLLLGHDTAALSQLEEPPGPHAAQGVRIGAALEPRRRAARGAAQDDRARVRRLAARVTALRDQVPIALT